MNVKNSVPPRCARQQKWPKLNPCIFARVCFEALQITQSHKNNIHGHILLDQISFTRKVLLASAHQQEFHKCFVNIRLYTK